MEKGTESSIGDGIIDFNEFRQLILQCVSDASEFCRQGAKEAKIGKISTTFIHAVAELLAAERINRPSQTIRDSLIRHDFLGTIGALEAWAALAKAYHSHSPFALRVQQLKQTVETKIGGNDQR